MLVEAASYKMYPLEDGITVEKFHKNGGTPLKAIKRYYRDFSGGSPSQVRDCWDVDSPVHPFRFGTNPNRKMSAERGEAVAARLLANFETARRRRLG